MDNSIGGYFELELPRGEEYHKNAIRLNTGRNAFEYILIAKKYKKIFLPYFTCDVMLEPIKKLKIDLEFYNIDIAFTPIFDFNRIKSDEAFVYTNYFGICDKLVLEISSKCRNLIIDNSQAFYSKPLKNINTFYSPRKFFGVPDGAYLYTDKVLNKNFEKDISYNHCTHLLGRIEIDSEAFYKEFINNEKRFNNQPIKLMSNLSRRLLSGIDYANIAKIRKNNFRYLHSSLEKSNELNIELMNDAVPMVYPYLTNKGDKLRKKYIQNKVFVATYWPNVFDWCKKNFLEYRLSKKILPLPVDQRYNEDEMKEIIKHIKYFY